MVPGHQRPVRRVCSPHTRGDGPGRRRASRIGGGSPHTRGDGPLTNNRQAGYVLPTRVGMVRIGRDNVLSIAFSPHAWGWSAAIRLAQELGRVLPTRVGMVQWWSALTAPARFSHTRGDGPTRPSRAIILNDVLPTRVGMVRSPTRQLTCCSGSPHTRGDGP